MAHPLDGCRAKIERADHHIRDLGSKIDAYLRTNFREPVAAFDEQTGEQVLKFGPFPTVPLVFGIIAGEIANQLRSSLDHLVHQLVLSAGARPTRETAFPVFDDRVKYVSAGARKIEGVSPQASALIEAQQPYHRGAKRHGHPLWVLNRLTNTDKHQAIAVCVAGVYPKHFGVEPGHSVEIVEGGGGPIRLGHEEETEIARISVPSGAPVKMKAELTLQVVFGPPVLDNRPVVPSLFHLMQLTRGTIEVFASQFS